MGYCIAHACCALGPVYDSAQRGLGPFLVVRRLLPSTDLFLLSFVEYTVVSVHSTPLKEIRVRICSLLAAAILVSRYGSFAFLPA